MNVLAKQQMDLVNKPPDGKYSTTFTIMYFVDNDRKVDSL